jgi:hypothetical protein
LIYYLQIPTFYESKGITMASVGLEAGSITENSMLNKARAENGALVRRGAIKRSPEQRSDAIHLRRDYPSESRGRISLASTYKEMWDENLGARVKGGTATDRDLERYNSPEFRLNRINQRTATPSDVTEYARYCLEAGVDLRSTISPLPLK